MLTEEKVVLYYFSGTGNTLKIANKIHGTLISNGYSAELKKMIDAEHVILPESCTLGLIFPVAVQSTFPEVWKFIDALPHGGGRAVFMADTMEQFSGGIVGPLKKVLTRKGYHCIGAREFKMSTSMQLSQKKKVEGEIKDIRALVDAEKYTIDLIEGNTKWQRIPLLSDLMRSISKNDKIWRQVSHDISVNHDKCIRCNLCVSHCPLGAMALIENMIQIDFQKCMACMRCVNYCPRNAFLIKHKEVVQKQVVPISTL